MSDPWWTRDATDPEPRVVPGDNPSGLQPGLLAADPASVRAEVAARIPAFTPEWTDLRTGDAGVALVRLFGSLLAPIRARANRLPDRALVEHLRVAGVERLPARAAEVMLELTVSDGAPGSVLVPAGFQVATDPADDSDDRVVFETERSLYAAPAALESASSEVQGLGTEVDPAAGFAPFGDAPRQGDALWLGLSGDTAPSTALSLGFEVAAPAGVPDPVVSGGVASPALPPPPLLRWELLDGNTLQRLEVVLDETASLQQSGVVELRLPRRWRKGRPAALLSPPELRWLRVRIVHGIYRAAPALVAVRLNVVSATAARTVRNEALERLPRTGEERRVRMRLSQTPVVPGSLEIEVDAVATGDVFGTGGGDEPEVWTEVADLASAGPADTVFTLDPEVGIVQFGDGRNGRAVPDGFRNVRARRYLVGGGRAGAIAAEAGPSMLVSIPFVTSVENPVPASGGVDAEPESAAIRRGPLELRARGRAVAPADYGLMALRAEGADLARAYAVPGLHPGLGGVPIPGLVGVFVVPSVRDDTMPVADAQTLRAVADHLAGTVAPAGVQVVAAAPRFHLVGVEARVVFVPGTDLGSGIATALDVLDVYLDPLRGGEDGIGWPPGGTLEVIPAVRRLLTRVPELKAVPQLNFVVDGVRRAPCRDVALTPHSLVWPGNHELLPVVKEVAS